MDDINRKQLEQELTEARDAVECAHDNGCSRNALVVLEAKVKALERKLAK